MDRQIPTSSSDEIDLYIRTYYSLLRSSGEVLVRAFEEAHIYSDCSLHAGARGPTPDVAAFAYSAARLPACMYQVRRVIMGQEHENFEAAGLSIRGWEVVRTRGRRRPLRWDRGEHLAAYIASTSDIDDLVPILTAYQIVWNQMHAFLAGTALGRRLADGVEEPELALDPEELATILGITGEDVHTLRSALDTTWLDALREIARHPADLRLRLLAGSLSQYQRTAQRWWSGIEPAYVRAKRPRRPPVYIVSSNTLRAFLHENRAESDPRRLHEIQAFEAESGIATLDVPGQVDVNAQLIELGRLQPERLDPRIKVPGIEALAGSDALILNIDYPLGVAAYHHLSRIAQGVGEIRGIYIMGKAATLNGRIGDVMIPTVVHDEHSRNTYLFRNAFAAADVQPYFESGTVLDQQKALTVRGAFLQNRGYMSVFYREGYTILEMEAGPYLSAIYEIVDPRRHPNDEIVHLTTMAPFDVGLLHYASDTPYSRRQSLLSKSLSFFGVDSTYACAIAICRKILANELARARQG